MRVSPKSGISNKQAKSSNEVELRFPPLYDLSEVVAILMRLRRMIRLRVTEMAI
jgi:hypothetical protein